MAGFFRFKASLPDLPKGAERAIIEQFKAVQSDLDAIRGPRSSASEVQLKDCTARPGQLLLVAPPSTGLLVGIPAGSSDNITKSIRIAVVGGSLSPGVAVTIIGSVGTINGQQVLYLNSYRLVELVSCGPTGWFYST